MRFLRGEKALDRAPGWLRATLALALVSLVIACSSETRQLFFDIPPPKPEVLTDKQVKDETSLQRSGTGIGLAAFFPGLMDDAPPPPIEKIEEWDEVEAMLPKDDEDDVDWSAAIRQDIIRPRHGGDPRDLLGTIFQWDFIIPVPPEDDEDEDEEVAEADEEDEVEGNEDDALFQHSSHTQWLSCDNCHMTIYPYRRNPFTMKQKKKGESCGVCHGKVAFSLKTCGRCHPNG
jgi:c(7)-type cytochrome triheme protein